MTIKYLPVICGVYANEDFHWKRLYNKFLVCLHVNIKSKYNFVETPRKFIIASFRPFDISIIISSDEVRAYGSKALR